MLYCLLWIAAANIEVTQVVERGRSVAWGQALGSTSRRIAACSESRRRLPAVQLATLCKKQQQPVSNMTVFARGSYSLILATTAVNSTAAGLLKSCSRNAEGSAAAAAVSASSQLYSYS